MLKPSSVALRRLEEISGRKSRQDLTRISHSSSELPVDPKEATNSSQAVPAAASASMAPLPDLALPQTPTTRRRQMLATELPEDLRMSELNCRALLKTGDTDANKTFVCKPIYRSHLGASLESPTVSVQETVRPQSDVVCSGPHRNRPTCRKCKQCQLEPTKH